MAEHPIDAVAGWLWDQNAVFMGQLFQVAFDGEVAEFINTCKIVASHWEGS